MKTIGKLLECDKCGERVFLTHLAGIYESIPEGWTYSEDLNMDLCPECSVKYEQLMFEFKKEKENEKI